MDSIVPSRRWVRWTALNLVLFGLIIVPFLVFGERLEAWVVSAVQALTEHPALLAVVIATMLASDVALPIPSSIVSVLAGALLGLQLGTAASAVGMTAGCLIGYGVGRFAGRGAVKRWIGPHELERLEGAAARHGDWMLISARAVPVLAEASTIFAGLSAMPPAKFFTLVVLSNLGISVVYAAVGAYAAEVQSFLLAFGGAVLLPLGAMILFRRRPGQHRGVTSG